MLLPRNIYAIAMPPQNRLSILTISKGKEVIPEGTEEEEIPVSPDGPYDFWGD